MLPYVAPYLLPALNTLMTCSVYGTVAVAMNRYIEMSNSFKELKILRNGKFLCFLVVVISVLFNASRWFELEYVIVSNASNNGSSDSNMTSLEAINSTVRLQVQTNTKDTIVLLSTRGLLLYPAFLGQSVSF